MSTGKSYSSQNLEDLGGGSEPERREKTVKFLIRTPEGTGWMLPDSPLPSRTSHQTNEDVSGGCRMTPVPNSYQRKLGGPTY